MAQGGKRVGAGRKRKPLAEKIANNAGRRPIKFIPNESISEIKGEDVPPPSEWLQDQTKNTQRASVANKVYDETWKWIIARRCDHLITKEQVEQYAMSVARYVQCEEGISLFGFLSKHPTTSAPVQSPYVAMSERFLKRANLLWATIYQIVKENCEVPVKGNHNEDIMEMILTNRI